MSSGHRPGPPALCPDSTRAAARLRASLPDPWVLLLRVRLPAGSGDIGLLELGRRRVTIARAMACIHPPEERQRVYEGTATPRAGRAYCGLCGEVLYLASELDRGEVPGSAAASRRNATPNPLLR